MYRILCDSFVLYDPRLPELFVFEPELTQKKNEPGALTFKIPKEHPHYGVLEKLKSRIKVYRDDIDVGMVSKASAASNTTASATQAGNVENKYEIVINNPKPEPASGSVRTTLLKHSYGLA